MRVLALALTLLLSSCYFSSERLLLNVSEAERAVGDGVELLVEGGQRYRFEFTGDRQYRIRSLVDSSAYDRAYVFQIGRLAGSPNGFDLLVAVQGESEWYYAFLLITQGQVRIVSDPRDFQGRLDLGANCRDFAEGRTCALNSREDVLRAYRVIANVDAATRLQRGQAAAWRAPGTAAAPPSPPAGQRTWRVDELPADFRPAPAATGPARGSLLLPADLPRARFYARCSGFMDGLSDALQSDSRMAWIGTSLMDADGLNTLAGGLAQLALVRHPHAGSDNDAASSDIRAVQREGVTRARALLAQSPDLASGVFHMCVQTLRPDQQAFGAALERLRSQ